MGGQKHFEGNDKAEVFIILQRRWEDAEGNIHAKRVGTGRELRAQHGERPPADGALRRHLFESYFKPYMGLYSRGPELLRATAAARWCRLLRRAGTTLATLTHMMVMFSSQRRALHGQSARSSASTTWGWCFEGFKSGSMSDECDGGAATEDLPPSAADHFASAGADALRGGFDGDDDDQGESGIVLGTHNLCGF